MGLKVKKANVKTSKRQNKKYNNSRIWTGNQAKYSNNTRKSEKQKSQIRDFSIAKIS
jgi:hypothetical protein